MAGLRKVLNKIFHDRCLTYYEYALDSKYTGILNMLGLHMVLNRILHTRYFTGF